MYQNVSDHRLKKPAAFFLFFSAAGSGREGRGCLCPFPAFYLTSLYPFFIGWCRDCFVIDLCLSTSPRCCYTCPIGDQYTKRYSSSYPALTMQQTIDAQTQKRNAFAQNSTGIPAETIALFSYW